MGARRLEVTASCMGLACLPPVRARAPARARSPRTRARTPRPRARAPHARRARTPIRASCSRIDPKTRTYGACTPARTLHARTHASRTRALVHTARAHVHSRTPARAPARAPGTYTNKGLDFKNKAVLFVYVPGARAGARRGCTGTRAGDVRG